MHIFTHAVTNTHAQQKHPHSIYFHRHKVNPPFHYCLRLWKRSMNTFNVFLHRTWASNRGTQMAVMLSRKVPFLTDWLHLIKHSLLMSCVLILVLWFFIHTSESIHVELSLFFTNKENIFRPHLCDSSEGNGQAQQGVWYWDMNLFLAFMFHEGILYGALLSCIYIFSVSVNIYMCMTAQLGFWPCICECVSWLSAML